MNLTENRLFSIIFVATGATTSAMAQTNPFGMLQQLQKTVEQSQSNANAQDQSNASSAPAGKQVPPTEAKGNIPRPGPAQAEKQVSRPVAVENTSAPAGQLDFCQRVATDPTLKRYADIRVQLSQIRFIDENLKNIPVFDKDKLIQNWIKDKVVSSSRKNRDDDMGDREQLVYGPLNDCAYTLLSKDISNINLFSGLSTTKFDNIKKKYASKHIRSLDRDGNIVEATSNEKKIVWGRLGVGNMFHDWDREYARALQFDGGDKVLANVAKEYFDIAEPLVKAAAAKSVQLEREAKEKAAAAAAATAATAATQAEDKKRRFADYKSGSYKSTKSCAEIAEFLGNQSGIESGMQPLIKPSNGHYFWYAKLEKFQENGSTGNGYIKNKGQYGVVKSDKNTIWLNKERIKINEEVCVVGKYVDNTSVPLASGGSQQAVVLDLICVEPGFICVTGLK